jgi:hypothetical protein
VGATPKLDRVDSGFAAHPIRIDVVEFDERALIAAATSPADEGATPAVAQRDGAPDPCRDVP